MAPLHEFMPAMLARIGLEMQSPAVLCHPPSRLQPSSANSVVAAAGSAGQLPAPTEGD